ncbi:MAG: peptidase [Ignavibacteria bacterium]|nr:peptidase [Ignavibacteria bacterium]
MKNIIKVVTAIIFILTVDLSAQYMTPEILLSLKRVSEIKLSPNGKWVAYNLGTPNINENKVYKDIYAVSFDGKETIRLTDDPASDFNACWSPDGKQIAYISTASGKAQIWIMDFPDGKPLQVTNILNGVENLAWSPDGKYFSFTSDVKMEQTVAEKNPCCPKVNIRIYDKLPVRHWDEWRDESYSHLFIIPVSGGTPRDLMAGEHFDTPLKPFGGDDEICWSPDSKEIAYTCKKVDNFVSSTNSDIYTVNIETGATKNISNGLMGFDKSPLYSPDGKWIAFHSQEHDGFESDRVRLMAFNRKTGEIEEVSKKIDQWVGQMVWSPDSRWIYFSAEEKAVVRIYKVSVINFDWIIITNGWENYDSGLQITHNGLTFVAGRRNMLRPVEIYTLSVSGENIKQITDVNGDIYSKLKLPTITERIFKSTDGANVQGWVLFPPDFDSTKKYPMITYCQGGPQSTISQYFSFRWNYCLMASQGYVLLMPNRRGVPGFGQAWNNAISRDWAGKPMQDILSANDAMLKESYINPKGVAAVGASAGGYAVFWLAGNHNKRFSAFVSHCGVFNLESMYGATEELWFPNWEYGGPYWDLDLRESYDKNSPHRFSQNWDTPIMISTGERDYRVPFTQSLEAYTVAQSKGIPSKFIIFPEENHWILKPQNALVWNKEFFGFLNKYCKK